MFQPNEVAEVHVPCLGCGSDGYLVAAAGERIEVICFQGEEDTTKAAACGGGWVYARMVGRLGCGWMPANALGPLTLCSEVVEMEPSTQAVHLQIGAIVSTRGPLEPLPDAGYLQAPPGTLLKVMHFERDDAGTSWIFAENVDIENVYAIDHPEMSLRGWLPSAAVRLASPDAAVLRKTQLEEPTTPRPLRHCPVADDARESGTALITHSHIVAGLDSSSSVNPPIPVKLTSHIPPPPPAPPADSDGRGTLRLITFGLGNCDSELIALSDHRGGASHAEISEEELLAALHRKQEGDVDLVIDARRFPNPERTHNTLHIGVHPDIIDQIVRHRNFPQFLKYVRARWRSVIRTRRSRGDSTVSMVIAVYCKSGKHRSVAVAECLREIGQRVQNLNFVGRHDLSENSWGRKICRGTCPECTTPSVVKQAALDFAANIWRQP